ncbi:MAG: DEAD/DEAH box helicase [Deltaproteobacteria bacterium]|jgi:superfamily II RNA helicase|nr:DEAD/DEAH box helicase [Deltaproteobacteria bacterium]
MPNPPISGSPTKPHKFKPKKTKKPLGYAGQKTGPKIAGHKIASHKSLVRQKPSLPVEPRVTQEAKKLLARIGLPESRVFTPDAFQIEAATLIKNHDVIVSAPTGSGKTWIAEQALNQELERGGRAWYASPLKALSNAKFLEFTRKFGEETVGLVTGDLRINSTAPIIVGTTEILRNQLYDSMSLVTGGQVNCDLVILDEAHYLGDPDRGVVWEEVLIYLPDRIRLLLLSATIDNAAELAAWLTKNRGRPTQIVMGGERPVPLAPMCYHHDGLETLAQTSKSLRYVNKLGRRGDWSLKPDSLLKSLEKLTLTPAIFFLASRRQCDLAAQSIPIPHGEDPERRQKRQILISEYSQTYPFLKNHHHINLLNNHAVASHHAGHLPIYKMLVEELMSQGLLTAIFATSTVAAGVNFPARTVVIPQSDRYNGLDFKPLTATELAQMTGRAGRRGRDKIGFAVILPGPYTQLKFIEALFNCPPEPIKSQLLINFPMVLNLLNALELDEIHLLFSRSLAAWQSTPKKNAASLGKAAEDIWRDFQAHWRFLKKIELVNQDDRLTWWGEMTAKFRLEHPLILYQCIRQKALPTEDPALLAAVMASVLNEKSQSSKGKPPQELLQALKTVHQATAPLIHKLDSHGFSWPSLDLGAAWATWAWANNLPFDKITKIYGHDEGDVARLILRAAERLNQLQDLPGQEELAKIALLARQKLLREPIL